MADSPSDSLFKLAESGDDAARQQLFASLYEELHRLARRELKRNGSSSLTLGATTLLHEAYLSIGERPGLAFPDRARFLTYASRAMRGLIIDYARRRQALKRGAEFEFTSLPAEIVEEVVETSRLQRLSDAIERLEAVEPRLAQVVDLKYFSGFSFGDIAAMWGMSERTVQRDWEKARIYLHNTLSGKDAEDLPRFVLPE